MPSIRIQKLLSDAGTASRRAIEQMILEGRITVNGELVASLPCFVDPAKDEIIVDGRPVRKRPMLKIYLLLNKPRGVVCGGNAAQGQDLRGRPSVQDILPPMPQRLLCIAPLDADSTGLVLLTNDGEWGERIAHSQLERQYVVEVDGRIQEDAINALKAGAYLDGRRTRGAHVKVLQRSVERSVIELDVAESVSREIRRILARVGHKVRRLKRVALGPLGDAGLKIGRFRRLTSHELRALEQLPPTQRLKRRHR